MALIFHRFAELERAEAFAASVVVGHGLEARVFATDEEAQADDPFPFELTPPIVHVDRDDDLELEASIEESVTAFGGTFAGT